MGRRVPTVESQPAKAAVPLSQPMYGASFVEAVTRFLGTRRFLRPREPSEFWWWVLASGSSSLSAT